MDSNASLARKQDELLSEHLSSVGGYPTSPRPAQRTTSPSYTPITPEQLYHVEQHQQQQQQQASQHEQHSRHQHRTLSQFMAPQSQRSMHYQPHQQPRPQEGMYMSSQQQRFHQRSPGPIPALLPTFQGFGGQGALPTAANGNFPEQTPGTPQNGHGVIRSASMYVANAASVGVMKYQQSYPRPQYSRYLEYNYREQQQRQYEQYEQESHYYREVTAQNGSITDHHSQKRAEPYGAPYRHSTYHGAYAAAPPVLPSQTPPQQQIQQIQAHRSLSLGPLPPNRFSVARDQLPTAPSPSVFSATQPAPVYPEHTAKGTRSAETLSGLALDASKSTDSLALSEISGSINQTSDILVARHPNRNSAYSVFSLGSPVLTERIARPLSAIQEPTGRFPVSPIGSSHHSASTTSLNTLTRSGSDPHRSSASNALMAQAKARAAQKHGYSRQITLSSIPPNEEVPPMPGKMTSKTGKVRIQITFDRPFFNAGGELSGRLEIQSSSSRSVMLADMMIELLGYEGLTKDHLAPKVFHKTVLRLQDMRHPSQAVQESIDPDSEGYWMARKGRTIFPFRLNIQDTLPNSYDSKLGQVRYVASAIALIKANNHKEIVNHTREVFIYETWTTDDIHQARRKSVKADTSKRLFMGGEGSLEMYAELTRTMVSSGGIVYVNVGVKNLTKKKIMGIKLSLWRHIAASNMRSSFSNQSSTLGNRDQDNVKNYSEIIYKGEDFAFDNDDPRVVVLPVYIPSGVYSLRNTSYLHVQFFVQVSLMTSMSKALAVELPVYITHASSWSDPPPRIPRDFIFPMHEDDPVKKNKTGVFSKKKTSSMPSQSNGSTNSLKKSPGTSDSFSTAGTSVSAPGSKSGTPVIPNMSSSDGSGSRPNTRRSPLKDPDSPTSVLDFSQAGNLFVVNPDTCSITTVSDVASLRQPLATRSAPSPRVLQSESGTPPVIPSTTPSGIPSSSSYPLDRSTPLMLVDQISVNNSDEPEVLHHAAETEQDFDMSRSVNASQVSSSKKDHEKSKLGKMGLRKTLAKLSITIPNHGSGATSLNKTPRTSPRALPTTPNSAKSSVMESPDEITSGDSRSLGDGQSLSRQSSGSSFGSFKRIFDSHSRKSSVGSTRVVSVSPGPISPNPSMRKLTKYPSSGKHSPALSATASDGPSRVPSGASTPTFHSMSSSTEARDRHNEIGQLSMTTAIPDVRLLRGTPVMDEMGREGYFEPNGSGSRSSTPSPSENRITTDHSSPITPNSFIKPWDGYRNHSSSSVNSSTLDPYDDTQTARSVRDEYYFGKNGHSRNVSIETFKTRVAPPQTGDPISQKDGTYAIATQVYAEPAAIAAQPLLNQGHPPSQEVFYDEMNLHQASAHVAPEGVPSHGAQTSQVESFKQAWGQRYKEDLNAELDAHVNHSQSKVPPAVDDRCLSPFDQMPAAPTQALAVPSGSMLTPVQSPERFCGRDEYPLPRQDLSPNIASRPESRSSPSHASHAQFNLDVNALNAQRPGISQIQYDHRSSPATPISREVLSRSASTENARAYSTPEYINVQLAASPQFYVQPHLLDPVSIQRSKQFSSEIYSTPMLLQKEAVMNGPHNSQSADSVLLTQPMTTLSNGDSFQPDHLRLSQNDVDVNQQLGAFDGLALMKQPYNPPASMTEGYPDNVGVHQDIQYNASPQSERFSSHPSRSNSRQESPKQWDTEFATVQQPPLLSGQDIRSTSYADSGFSQVLDALQPALSPSRVYGQATNVFLPRMPPAPLQSSQSVSQITYESRMQTPYQPRTQYKPRAQSSSDEQATTPVTGMTPPAGFSHRDLNIHQDSQLQGQIVRQLEPQAQLTGTSEGSFEIAPPPLPERPWGYQSPPLPINAVELLMNHVEVSTSVFHQENPYVNDDEGAPRTANFPAEDALVASSSRVDEEVLVGRHYQSEDQHQASGFVHSDVIPSGGAVKAEAHGSGSLQPLQPMMNSPAMARVNVTFRTSPLAFEGNVMTANSSSPPPPGTSQCIGSDISMADPEMLIPEQQQQQRYVSPVGSRGVSPVPPHGAGDHTEAREEHAESEHEDQLSVDASAREAV